MYALMFLDMETTGFPVNNFKGNGLMQEALPKTVHVHLSNDESVVSSIMECFSLGATTNSSKLITFG
jgi:hypothetical protein